MGEHTGSPIHKTEGRQAGGPPTEALRRAGTSAKAGAPCPPQAETFLISLTKVAFSVNCCFHQVFCEDNLSGKFFCYFPCEILFIAGGIKVSQKEPLAEGFPCDSSG